MNMHQMNDMYEATRAQFGVFTAGIEGRPVFADSLNLAAMQFVDEHGRLMAQAVYFGGAQPKYLIAEWFIRNYIPDYGMLDNVALIKAGQLRWEIMKEILPPVEKLGMIRNLSRMIQYTYGIHADTPALEVQND